MAASESAAGVPAGRSEAGAGIAAALVCYLTWGFLPLLFHHLSAVGALTVVADRTVWGVAVLAIALGVTGGFPQVRAMLADRRTRRVLLLSAALLLFNWLLFIHAVESGQVLETSFGYFINPLINVALGMLLLGERQSPLQLLAIGIACLAIVIQAFGVGGIPYVALGLAFSFGFYSYVRKTAPIGAISGLFVETLLILPLALGYLAWSFATSGPGPHADPGQLVLLMLTGPATALPLVAFGFAVRRLRLTTIGMLQYMSPTISFLLAIFVLGEPLNPLRLLSFVLIWVSLAVFTWDSFRRRPAAIPPAA